MCHFRLYSNENSCSFLTRKVKYNIYHNGTKGIKRAELFVVVRNATWEVGRSRQPFYQDFEVNFYWMNYTLNYSSLLSGNPGYLQEKPILIGTFLTLLNITNITGTNLTETKKYHVIERKHSDVAGNFLVFPTNENGFCKLNNNSHLKIEFGYNSIFKCHFADFVEVTKSPSLTCKNLQQHVFDQWSILRENSSRVVGRFGNANPNNIGEWVKILYNKQPANIVNATIGRYGKLNKTILCKGIVHRLSITVFHSRVDTKYYSNQEKIVGVLFKFGAGEDFEFALQKGRMAFDVPAHVDMVFVDTTKPKVKKFVDPPTFKIRLPYDFFYPFIKIHSKATYVNFNVLLLLIVLVNCLFLTI